MRTGRGGPAMGTVNRPAGRVSSRGSPSTSRPSGPADGEVNAVTLVASALRTKRAAWISSANTTTQPRSRSSGLAAARTAARMLAGPSAPAMAGVRIAPVTTTGSGPACSRSSRNAVSSMVSVPWITTAPAAPAASRSPIAADSSTMSSTDSEALGSWRNSRTSIRTPARSSPGTASSSCRPVSTAPGAMEMVPPRANTATLGRLEQRVSSMDLTA